MLSFQVQEEKENSIFKVFTAFGKVRTQQK